MNKRLIIECRVESTGAWMRIGEFECFSIREAREFIKKTKKSSHVASKYQYSIVEE